MLRNFLIVFFIILSPCILYAGELSGIVKDNSGEIIIGANLRWIGKSSGGVSGEDGRFSIPRATSDTKLIVSYIGYNTDTIEIKVNSKFEEIILSGGATLEEVVVTHRSVGLLHSRVETIQTQKINREELGRAACCNLAESFTTNPSVDVSYSDAVTGARQIRLLGLSGTICSDAYGTSSPLQGSRRFVRIKLCSGTLDGKYSGFKGNFFGKKRL